MMSTSSVTMVASEMGLAIPGYLRAEFRDVRQRQILGEGSFGIAYIADSFNTKLNTFGNLVVVKQLKKSRLSEGDVKLFRVLRILQRLSLIVKNLFVLL